MFWIVLRYRKSQQSYATFKWCCHTKASIGWNKARMKNNVWGQNSRLGDPLSVDAGYTFLSPFPSDLCSHHKWCRTNWFRPCLRCWGMFLWTAWQVTGQTWLTLILPPPPDLPSALGTYPDPFWSNRDLVFLKLGSMYVHYCFLMNHFFKQHFWSKNIKKKTCVFSIFHLLTPTKCMKNGYHLLLGDPNPDLDWLWQWPDHLWRTWWSASMKNCISWVEMNYFVCELLSVAVNSSCSKKIAVLVKSVMKTWIITLLWEKKITNLTCVMLGPWKPNTPVRPKHIIGRISQIGVLPELHMCFCATNSGKNAFPWAGVFDMDSYNK